jgi:hypothetical protein
MPKNLNSKREPKKRPVLTMKEKRAVKKAKNSERALLLGDRTTTR